MFDPEFSVASEAFFEQARDGSLEVTVSTLVLDELEGAPAPVRSLFSDLAPILVRGEVTEAAYMLRQAYIDAGVVSARWRADALHVATASASGCHAIVSWNFKHIVNFQRIPLYKWDKPDSWLRANCDSYTRRGDHR